MAMSTPKTTARSTTDGAVGDVVPNGADDPFDGVGDIGGPVGVGDRVAWHGGDSNGRAARRRDAAASAR